MHMELMALTWQCRARRSLKLLARNHTAGIETRKLKCIESETASFKQKVKMVRNVHKAQFYNQGYNQRTTI